MCRMTTTLHLPARAGAAIACDMTTASDTPDERMREYDRLFAGAMLVGNLGLAWAVWRERRQG